MSQDKGNTFFIKKVAKAKKTKLSANCTKNNGSNVSDVTNASNVFGKTINVPRNVDNINPSPIEISSSVEQLQVRVTQTSLSDCQIVSFPTLITPIQKRKSADIVSQDKGNTFFIKKVGKEKKTKLSANCTQNNGSNVSDVTNASNVTASIFPPKRQSRPFSKIVFGDFSQFSYQFPLPQDQCTAMAGSALAYASIKDIDQWDELDINLVLITGQTYYERSMFNLRLNEPTYSHTYLEAIHLAPQIEVGMHNIQLVTNYHECQGGTFDCRDNFANALAKFEGSQFTYGIITYASSSYGILRKHNSDGTSSYVFFDSHGRKSDGTKHGDRAAILFFVDANAFINFFLQEYPLLRKARRSVHDISRHFILVPIHFLTQQAIEQLCPHVLENRTVNIASQQPLPPDADISNLSQFFDEEFDFFPPPLIKRVVSGNFAQNDDRFPVASRNSQCTANSVVFLAFASVIKGNWTCPDLDNILRLGNHIYVVSYREAIKLRPRSHPFLAAHEVVERIFVHVNRVNSDVFTVLCKALPDKEYSGNFGKFGLSYIQRFFTNYCNGVFICSSLSVALHKCNDEYIVFDPHARSVEGAANSNGSSNIFFFTNIKSLFEFLCRCGYSTFQEFTLTPFTITHDKNSSHVLLRTADSTVNAQLSMDSMDDIPYPESDGWDSDDAIPLKDLKDDFDTSDDNTLNQLENSDSSDDDIPLNQLDNSDSSDDIPLNLLAQRSKVDISSPTWSGTARSHKRQQRKYVRNNKRSSQIEQTINNRWKSYKRKVERSSTPNVFVDSREFKALARDHFEKMKEKEFNDGLDEALTKAADAAIATMLLTEEARRLRMLNRSLLPYHFNAYCNHEDINESDKRYALYTLSSMDKVCPHCGALYFEEECNTRKVFTTCCNSGEIHNDLPQRQDGNYPYFLRELLLRQIPISQHFLDSILLYNNVLSFASLGTTNLHHLQSSGTIGPVLAIEGMIYHIAEQFRTNSTGAETPTAQLYYMNLNDGLDERDRRAGSVLNRGLLRQLEIFMRANNPLASAYSMLKDVLAEVRRRPNAANTEVHLEIVRNRNQIRLRQNHLGDYNLPTSNEVAAVFTERPLPGSKNIVVFPVDQPPENGIPIASHDPNRDAMLYPLLFPFSEQTWSYNLFRRDKQTNKVLAIVPPSSPMSVSSSGSDDEFSEDDDSPEENRRVVKKRKRITLREFCCFQLSVRKTFSPLLNAGKLTQQFIIDCYARVQENYFEYLESEQGQIKIRAETYGVLKDYVEKKNIFQPDLPGKLIVMPQDIVGSRQYMTRRFNDAMAYVSKFGKPTFFVTMTCNPTWFEIVSKIPNFNPIDHPHIVARVFRAKSKDLFADITKKHVLGKCTAALGVIEWQKRGLPHCHLVVFTSPEDRPASPVDVDHFVSAEIPDPIRQPRLYKAVTSYMYHHRCDVGRPETCMVPKKNGTGDECSKHFPRKFVDQSQLIEGGYPIYRRRNDGRTFTSVRGQEIDNQFIVPYNPYLLLKYNCHINVEITSGLKHIKYLFKYLHKGFDMARLKISIIDGVQVYNEFEHFVDSRYLSAGEAIWKLYDFPQFMETHTVYALPVHLENYQNVIFDPQHPARALQHADSMLTAFFRLNSVDSNANQYLYTDIPLHYVYNKVRKIWTLRKRRQDLTLARLYLVNYNKLELYSLRLLLLTVRGPQSYEHIREVNDIQYDTFREAAAALGLLDDDNMQIATFKEIIDVEMPRRIRCLFANMLIFFTPSDPLAIWTEFKKRMYEDYERKGCTELVSLNLALRHISYLLVQAGKTNSTFDLPEPHFEEGVLQQALVITESTDVDTIVQLNEAIAGDRLAQMLNNDQRRIFDVIVNMLNNPNMPDQNRLIFVDGPGGTGKTFLFSALISVLRGMGFKILPIAWTGIAASLLKGGRTAHSTFKLPFDMSGPVNCNISSTSELGKEMREVDIIVWDEISMTLRNALDGVDRFLRDLMGNNEPFGGKVVVATGDFRQILPIVVGGSKHELLAASVKKSKVWPLFKKYSLSINVRLSNPNDIEFAQWLLDVGEGKLEDFPANHYYNNYVKIPTECTEPNSLIDRIYGKTFSSSDVESFSKFVVVTTLNEDVDFLNCAIYPRLSEDVCTEKQFFSSDRVLGKQPDDEDEYDIDILHRLEPPRIPPHILTLKENCIVMLLCNLNPARGLCNGTRMIVTKVYNTCIRAKILAGDFKGEETLLCRNRLSADCVELSGKLERIQIPVKLAFAMTINKAQGQTFEHVGVYLRKPPFSHGQLYVALSRVRSKEKLLVQVLPDALMGKLNGTNDVFVPNIVYKEVL